MRTLIQDLRYAARALARTPGFTAIAVATLALGIGANTAIFSVVRGVLLRRLPYADADRLVVVWEDLLREENHLFSVARPNFSDLSERARCFAGLAAQLGRGAHLTGPEGPESVLGAQVTGNFFEVLGARAAIGRTIGEEDERNGPAAIAVLRDSVWKRRFGSDPDILGKKILLDGRPFSIVGVMPPDFDFPSQLKAPHMVAEIWSPLDLPPAWNARGVATLQVVGRLARGVTFEAADEQVRSIARDLAARFPDTNANIGMHAVPLTRQMFGDVRPGLVVLTAAAGLLLVVACANIAHLLLARAGARRREIALRIALGAGQGRILRWLLAEALLLAAAGGAIGYAIAAAATRALLNLAPQHIPRLDQVRPDAAVLLFALGATSLAGVASGLWPALRAASNGLERDLRRGGWTASPGPDRLRSAVVVSQVAIALLLFSGAALLVKTFENLRRFDTGFSSQGVMTARLFLPKAGYETPQRQIDFFERTFARLRGIPGVDAVGGTSRFPLDPAYGVGSIRFEGRDFRGASPPVVGVRLIAGDYFRALRIPLLQGRSFDASDHAGEPTALVNRTMASRFWPGETPVGRRISIGGPTSLVRVVGVVGNVSHDGIDAAPLPEVYLPFLQNPDSGLNVVVRATGGFPTLAGQIRRAVRAEDPDLPLVELRPMAERVQDALAEPRFLVQTLGFFGGSSLLLAALALFGLVTNDTVLRRREIGIRLALGGPPSRVAGLFVLRAMRLVAIGAATGLAGVAIVAPRLGPALHGTPPDDPRALVAAAAVLVFTALVAVLVPVLRSLRSDPLESLRSE